MNYGSIENQALVGAQILLVDDEPDNLTLLENLFSYLNAVVTVANSGQAAIDLLKQRVFDVILLDIRMPTVSGETVIDYIRGDADETRRRVPVIAVTSHAMLGDRERLLALGFDAYLSKPLDVQEIMRLVARYLSNRPHQANPPA